MLELSSIAKVTVFLYLTRLWKIYRNKNILIGGQLSYNISGYLPNNGLILVYCYYRYNSPSGDND